MQFAYKHLSAVPTSPPPPLAVTLYSSCHHFSMPSLRVPSIKILMSCRSELPCVAGWRVLGRCEGSRTRKWLLVHLANIPEDREHSGGSCSVSVYSCLTECGPLSVGERVTENSKYSGALVLFKSQVTYFPWTALPSNANGSRSFETYETSQRHGVSSQKTRIYVRDVVRFVRLLICVFVDAEMNIPLLK